MFLIATTLLLLQTATTAPQAPPPNPCAQPEYRQLDVWVGDWDVYGPKGKLAGRNTITREYGGCVVQEHWVGQGGMSGSSFNTYEPATGRWHQVWVDNGGTFLTLAGRRDGEAIAMDGDMPTRTGKVKHSLRLTPREGGKVHQLWRTSADEGKTWTVVFDGTYVRRPLE